jgi:adenosylmethionine-8-amino-7-oxononanoate aminotransferase
MTVAKGITSGYIPMGAAIVRKEVADAFIGSEKAAFRHIITFGGHPVACAAALANIEIMEREGLVENAALMGRHLLEGLRELQERHPAIGDVRGLGLMCSVELVKDRETKEPFPREANLRERLTLKFLDRGVILRGGDIINIYPPLCISRDEVDQLLRVLDQVIGEVERELGVA